MGNIFEQSTGDKPELSAEELEKQQQKITEALQDPEKKAQLEALLNHLNGLSPEGLDHVVQTGELAPPSAGKGINFEMKYSVDAETAKEAFKSIAGVFKTAEGAIGSGSEILKKIPPEAILALLA